MFVLSLRGEVGTRGLYLFKYTPVNNLTLVTSYADATITDGAERLIKVVAKGNSIKCYLSGVERISVTDSSYLTATKHGIMLRRGAALDFQAVNS